jgi:hypothetical protein
MLFGKKSSKRNENPGLYDFILFITLIVKIVYVITAIKNRIDPNDRSQYIMILARNVFTILICSLLLYLFHPYSKHPTEVWKETKMFFFLYAMLTLFEIDWNVFVSPMTAVLSSEDGVDNTISTFSENTSTIESTMHKMLCRKDGAYSEPKVDVGSLRDFCSHSQIDTKTVAAIIIVIMISIFGIIHIRRPHGGRLHSKILIIFLATIAFAVAFI